MARRAHATRGPNRRRARSSPGTRAPSTAAMGGRNRSRCSARAEGDERRPEQFLAHVADPGRRVRSRVLLVENHLLGDRRARGRRARPASRCRSSLLRRDAGSRPAARSNCSCSRPGTAEAAYIGELAGQVRLEPVADASPELLILGRQLHCISCGGFGARTGRVALGWPRPGQRRTRQVGSPYQALACFKEPGGADDPGSPGRGSAAGSASRRR